MLRVPLEGGEPSHGTTSRRDSPPKSAKLNKMEEEAIVEKILDLDSRSSAPWISDVGAMANFLLATRGAPPVGVNWVYKFI